MRTISALFLILLLTPAAAAETITGRASVIDGDTITIHGTRIRLHGIDAPESGQSCGSEGKRWRCGQQAALALAKRIGSAPVACLKKDVDRYKRVVAVCRSGGGEDMNAWMVFEGWAMAYRQYSTDYIRQEDGASRGKVGIWRGEFVPPWDWRRGKRLTSAPSDKAAHCLIKGNIGRRGARIFHVPGGQYNIDGSKGERWFCNEAEARAAGWRRSRR